MESAPKGFTVWFTGQSETGKSTLAGLLAKKLKNYGHDVEVLDEKTLFSGSPPPSCWGGQDIERVAVLCRLLNRNHVVAVVVETTATRKNSEAVGTQVKHFIEVCLDGPPESTSRSDATQSSQTVHQTSPAAAHVVVVVTGKDDAQESVYTVLSKLSELNYIIQRHGDTQATAYTRDEEELMKQRLSDLGYL